MLLITGRKLSILGTFAKFRKASYVAEFVLFGLHVHPSIHPQWNNSNSSGQVF